MNVNSRTSKLRTPLPPCDYSSYNSVKEWEESHGEVADSSQPSALLNEPQDRMRALGESVAQLPSGEDVPQCDYASAQSVTEWEELYGASVDSKPSEMILSADFLEAVTSLDSKDKTRGQSLTPETASADIAKNGQNILEQVRRWDGDTTSDTNWSPRAVTVDSQGQELSAAAHNSSNAPTTLAQEMGTGSSASAIYIRQREQGQTDMFTMTRTANNGVIASKTTIDPVTGTAWLITQ